MNHNEIKKIIGKANKMSFSFSRGGDILKQAVAKMGYNSREVVLVDENTFEPTRWSIPTIQIYKVNDYHIAVSWRHPATEMQSGQPTDMEIYEVKPKKVTKTEWYEVE